MQNGTSEYSTKKMSNALIADISTAIKSVEDYGSVEVYVQQGVVTQITTRTIKKTNNLKNKSQ